MARHVVALAVTDAIPVFEFATVFEIFGVDRSDLVTPWYELRLCAGQDGPLHTTGGLRLDAPYGLADVVAADTIIVPACARATQVDPPAGLLTALGEAHAAGRRIVAICTGAYLLAAAGLLDGRRATTHWMNVRDFAHRFPAVTVDPDVLYVDEGDVLTSAGTAAAIDVCLHLVRRDHGTAVAAEVARRMVVPPHREAGHAQRPKPVLAPGDGNGELGAVLEWARHHLDQPLTVDQLARVAHVSPRTFARRFRATLGITPLQWLLEQRIRLAQELLETTDEPIERIARRAGFGTGASLRQHFARLTSVSPQTYRHVFRHRNRSGGRSAPVAARYPAAGRHAAG